MAERIHNPDKQSNGPFNTKLILSSFKWTTECKWSNHTFSSVTGRGRPHHRGGRGSGRGRGNSRSGRGSGRSSNRNSDISDNANGSGYAFVPMQGSDSALKTHATVLDHIKLKMQRWDNGNDIVMAMEDTDCDDGR